MPFVGQCVCSFYCSNQLNIYIFFYSFPSLCAVRLCWTAGTLFPRFFSLNLFLANTIVLLLCAHHLIWISVLSSSILFLSFVSHWTVFNTQKNIIRIQQWLCHYLPTFRVYLTMWVFVYNHKLMIMSCFSARSYEHFFLDTFRNAARHKFTCRMCLAIYWFFG